MIPSPCPPEGEPEKLASEQREVSTATCRLQLVSGEGWTGTQRIKGPTVGFSAPRCFQVHLNKNNFRGAKVQLRPGRASDPTSPARLPSISLPFLKSSRGPDFRQIHGHSPVPVLLTSWESFYLDSRAVSASRPTEKK